MPIRNWMRSGRNRLPSDKNTAHHRKVQQAAAELDQILQAMDRKARRKALNSLLGIVLLIGLLVVMTGLLILVIMYPIWAWGLISISLVAIPNLYLEERVSVFLSSCMILTTIIPPPIGMMAYWLIWMILTVFSVCCSVWRRYCSK